MFLYFRFEFVFDTTDENGSIEEKSEVIENWLSDKYFNQIQVVAIINFLQWLRVLLILNGSKTFGPMIETIFSMIRTLVVFAVLLIFIILIYIFSGTILFSETKEFRTYDSAALFLFQSMLGNFDFEFKNVSGLLVPKYFGDLFLGSYLAITMIILLNFLIAILSGIYTELQDKSKQMYLSRILKIDQVRSDDKNYSCLVSMPAPFVVLLVPFIPFLIRKPNPRLNQILMYLWYIPTLIVAILWYIMCWLVTLPFSYLAIIYRQAINMLKACKYSFSSFMCELLTLIMFILFGIIYLFIVGCIQMYYYIFDLFIGNQKYKDEVEQFESNGFREMSKEMFTLVWEFVWDHDEEEIEVKDIVTKIKEKLNIDSHIRNQLFCSDVNLFGVNQFLMRNRKTKTPPRTEPATQRLFEQQFYNRSVNLSQDNDNQSDSSSNESEIDPNVALKQYNAAKRFLWENSISKTRNVKVKEEPMSTESLSKVQSDTLNESKHASNTSCKLNFKFTLDSYRCFI